MAHRDLGYKIINRLIMDVGENGVVEFMPRMEGTTLHAIIAPVKKAEVQVPAAPKPKPLLLRRLPLLRPAPVEAEAAEAPQA